MKTVKNFHTPKSQIGMGDYYGTAVKQKMGRMREDFMNTIDVVPNKLKKPPKSLA